MIGAWLGQSLPLLAAFALVFAPGLAIGAGLRLRGLALWALAPVGSTVLFAGLAVVYGAVGIRWSPLSALAGAAIAVAIAWAAALALGPRRPRVAVDRRARLLLAAGLVVGIAFVTLRFAVYVGSPDALSQTNDAVFHLNAIRYIVEHGSASSFQVNAVIGGRGFYPAAWHAFASLVVLVTGTSVPVAANVVSLVIAAAVWPVGIAWFTRIVSRGSVGATAAAAALSAALPAFPMLMFQWGVLYSYALSVALLPASAAVVLAGARWSSGGGPVVGRARSAVLGGILSIAALGALALSQPASLLTWGVVVAVAGTWWAIPRMRRAAAHRGFVIAAVVIGWVAFVVLWLGLTRVTTGSHWPAFRSKALVLFDVLLNGQVGLPWAVGVSILMAVGLVVAVRRRVLRWLAVVWLVFSGMYVVSAAVGSPALRTLLLGAWYADPYRIAAIAPLTVAPLAAIGLTAVATWAATVLSARRMRAAEEFGTAWALAAVAAVQAVAFAVSPMIQLSFVSIRTTDTESRYATTSFLSPDERALLERLPGEVPDGARVIGNPSTGSGFGYMLSGVDVFPRTWAHPSTSAWRVIMAGLRDVATDPEVCDALAQYGSPGYALDFGLGDRTPGRYEVPGMTGFDGRPGFALVDREGGASLWRITACSS